jgi:hypothetical protein
VRNVAVDELGGLFGRLEAPHLRAKARQPRTIDSYLLVGSSSVAI